MPNYKIIVQYDGTNFFGWQSQPQGNTIQDEITKAIYQITRKNINLIGSGRTDSGVHALGQVANFRITSNLEENKFVHSLNSILPSAISIKDINQVNNDFHARFDAKKRSYIYLISRQKSPFYDRYSYHYPFANKIDVSKLKLLSGLLVGENNFSSFCKTKTETENKNCEVYEISWRNTKDHLIFKIEANRFLHGMVRAIVGTLLYSSQQNNSEDYIKNVLKTENRSVAGESVPARGLFLYKVWY